MTAFENILLLIDCSPADHEVIKVIKKMMDGADSKLTLVHVIHSHTLDQQTALRKKATEYLESYKEDFINSGIKNTSKLFLSGEPEVQLIKEINEGNYDLVAMGTHGHKGFQDLLYGSVSTSLKHHIKTPLLLVKGSLQDV
ncbi:MAG: universal stress protein [Spirochaetaceae bacterium]|nr:universal stress protein [Spirochaetaceae bacterium]